jgi:hypothetical protein
MTTIALCRTEPESLGRFFPARWARERDNRRGQDKARKVRAVGCGWVERRIPAISQTLCSTRRNLRFLAKCYCRSAFDTL